MDNGLFEFVWHCFVRQPNGNTVALGVDYTTVHDGRVGSDSAIWEALVERLGAAALEGKGIYYVNTLRITASMGTMDFMGCALAWNARVRARGVTQRLGGAPCAQTRRRPRHDPRLAQPPDASDRHERWRRRARRCRRRGRRRVERATPRQRRRRDAIASPRGVATCDMSTQWSLHVCGSACACIPPLYGERQGYMSTRWLHVCVYSLALVSSPCVHHGRRRP